MVEYVGLDVSKEETSFCVKDGEGLVLASGKTWSDPASIFEALRTHSLYPERVVLETGALSPWLARGLRAKGLPVVVIDARQAHAVMRLQANKTDAHDAELLADLARTGFYRGVFVADEPVQLDRALLKARRHLVRQRRDCENMVRGLLATFGLRFAKGSGKLAARVEVALAGATDGAAELRGLAAPLLRVIAQLRRQTSELDDAIGARVAAQPSCQLLMTVPGVGRLTALAFSATIDDPRRFARSRDVAAYLGLTSRRYQSGEMDYSGRISKRGNGMLRSLLYEAANVLLNIVRRAHPLKDWARRIRKRGCHKKACIALARKLAVILHRMLCSGEAFRWPVTA